MGEAKRKREAGIRTVLPRDLAAELNRRLGAEVWFPGDEEPVTGCFVIGEDGRRDGLADVFDEELDARRARPHRVVMTELFRDGRCLVAAAAVDFSPEHPAGEYEAIGGEAAELYREMRGSAEGVRIRVYTVVDTHREDGGGSGGIVEALARGFLPLDDAGAETLLREGWPEAVVRDLQYRGGAYHPGRRSLSSPDFPGAELRWNGSSMIVDVRSER